MRPRVIALVTLLVLTGLLPVLAPRPAQSQTNSNAALDFGTLITSTVQIYVCEDLPLSSGSIDLATFYATWNGRSRCALGSGTVIRPDGVILTNAHVALNEEQTEPLWLLVKQTVNDRSLPPDAFFARVVLFGPRFVGQGFVQSGDAYLDLAVAVPAFALDGTPIQPGDVSMRPLPMAEAESVSAGDRIYNFGYPGIGGDLITITEGIVSGFVEDPYVPQLGLTGWIKTDSVIAGGNSGGTSINLDGEFIGVPTQGVADFEGEGATWANINHLRPIPEGYDLLLTTGDGEGIPEAPSVGEPPANGATADVTVTGTIVSADTGRPIGGAWFIVLKPGVPVAEFLGGNQEAVYSFTTSAADGQFQLPHPVARDQAYGVLVIARGYQNLDEDNRVLATADSPAVVTLPPIEMAVQR